MGYRRRQSQNVRDYSREQVASAVAERMKIRHHLLAPCPLKPVDIYRHLWTKEDIEFNIKQSEAGVINITPDSMLAFSKFSEHAKL